MTVVRLIDVYIQYKENMSSGSAAAFAGGAVMVLGMSNT